MTLFVYELSVFLSLEIVILSRTLATDVNSALPTQHYTDIKFKIIQTKDFIFKT